MKNIKTKKMKITNCAVNALVNNWTKYSELFKSDWRTNFEPVIIIDRRRISYIIKKNINMPSYSVIFLFRSSFACSNISLDYFCIFSIFLL